MVTKKAKTTSGKWGQKQKIEREKKALKKFEEDPDVITSKLKKIPGYKKLVRSRSKKRIEGLESDPEYKEGKRYEKRHDEGWGKYEKGEHYAGGGRATHGYGRAYLKGGRVK